MTEVNTDVKTSAVSSVVDSSPAGGNEGSNETKASAGTGNTDDYSNVPFNQHPRFQEVIKQKNEYKTKASEYEKRQAELDKKLADLEVKAKKYDEYNDWDGLISSNPAMREQVLAMVEKARGGNNNNTQSDGDLPTLNATVNALVKKQADDMYATYGSEFDSVIEKNEKDIEEEEKEYLKNITVIALDKKFPDWRKRYTHGLVEKAYKEATSKLFDKRFEKKKTEYLSSKEKNNVPTNTGNSPASNTQKIGSSREDRLAAAKAIGQAYDKNSAVGT